MKDLSHITHFYFLGIGGIGMSALARYFHSLGKTVHGYDRTGSVLTDRLVDEGIGLQYEDEFNHVRDGFKDHETSLVVYTPAVPHDLELLLRFRESGIPTIKRAQLLGLLSSKMTCLAVAGTHGKTTTSAILAHLLYKSGVKMTAFLGGIVEEYQSNFLHTGDEVMVVEADEFDRSFLHLKPNIAGITSMDADHLDIYGDPESFQATFQEFSRLESIDRLLVQQDLTIPGIKVGVEGGAYCVENVVIVDGNYHFDLKTPRGIVNGYCLKLPGRHNLFNAILALSMAIEYGLPAARLKAALLSFQGVQRRFSYRLNTDKRVLIDDYAHHPTEIDAVHAAVREMYPDDKITAVFQPHLFSRTRDFADEFAAALAQFDVLGLLAIYPAREEPIDGVDTAMLCNKINMLESKPEQTVIVEKEDVLEFVKELGTRVVLMIGAGDIGVEVFKLIEALGRE
ncbi:MAG: UDP-N-acetylmuramate--L-alanine ligase [Nonlabens sp.]